jgi:hypothetical protein
MYKYDRREKLFHLLSDSVELMIPKFIYETGS